MRVTDKMRFSSPSRRLGRINNRIRLAQEKISSGLAINRPSDDPLGAKKARETSTHLRRVEQHKRNLDKADTVLRHADGALRDAVDTVFRIKELTIQSLSSVLTLEDSDSIADEIDRMREHLLTLANSRAANQYVFGGYQFNQQPYDAAYQFVSDQNEVSIEVGDGQVVPITVQGGQAFGDQTGATVDVFDNLIDLAAVIRAQDEPNTQNELARLETSLEQIIDAQTEVGIRLSVVEAARTVNVRLDEHVSTDLSEIQDADFPEVVSELQLAQHAFEAVLQSASRDVNASSLLDVLR